MPAIGMHLYVDSNRELEVLTAVLGCPGLQGSRTVVPSNTNTWICADNVTTATQTIHNLYPALRGARWRRWLVIAALVCTIGIYSIELTHLHRGTAAELACPVCHVLAHGAPNLLKPNLTPLVSFAGWYRHDLSQSQRLVISPQFDLKPQPRAPPVITPSLV